jgi:hypothetical protein
MDTLKQNQGFQASLVECCAGLCQQHKAIGGSTG